MKAISVSKTKQIKRFPFLLVSGIALLIVSGCGASFGDAQVYPQKGTIAPDFTLSDLDGNLINLADFRGKTVLLNFWATWCPPCRKEMPDIEAVYQGYKDLGVEVIGIDRKESKSTVETFVQEGRYSWTFLLDTSGDVFKDYRVSGIPKSFFVDEAGIIREIHIGQMSQEIIEEKLKETMNSFSSKRQQEL